MSESIGLPDQGELFDGQAPHDSPDFDSESQGTAATEDRSAELERELAAANARAESMAQALDRFAALPPQREPEAPPAPEVPGPMPDPTTEPGKFQEWYAQDKAYTQHAHEQRLAAMRAEQDERDRQSSLYADFQRSYPQYASPELVDAVRVAFVLESGGELPPAGQESTFLDKIAKRMDDLGSKLGSGSAPSNGSSAANRTGGVSGGSAAARSEPKSDPQPETFDFTKELEKLQSDTGLY